MARKQYSVYIDHSGISAMKNLPLIMMSCGEDGVSMRTWSISMIWTNPLNLDCWTRELLLLRMERTSEQIKIIITRTPGVFAWYCLYSFPPLLFWLPTGEAATVESRNHLPPTDAAIPGKPNNKNAKGAERLFWSC